MSRDAFPETPAGRLLRLTAGVDDDADSRDAIRRACRRIENWGRLVDQAEAHGLAPYLHKRITESGAPLPDEARRQLQSLTLRHRDSNRIRDRALGGIIQTLEARGIEVIVLKGAALAHLVYERPGLRPMSDIDLLVAPGRLTDAAGALQGLGYAADTKDRAPPDHHHLPAFARTVDGLHLSIEIHHNALAPDNIGSLRLDALTEPPRPFRLGDTDVQARALGHIDMLRHLWRHALQPRTVTKLGAALDIMLYVSRFADDMDWPRIRREHPDLLTGLSLLGCLVPLPVALAARAPAAPDSPPDGVGVGMPPLSVIRARRHRPAAILHPSEWWLRAFYSVPPGRSLLATRTIRHPARVLYWVWRRVANRVRL